MAESNGNVGLERVGALMRGLASILASEVNGLQAKDCIHRLQSVIAPTEHELGEYRDGSQRFDKIVRFSTIDLVKAGWLLKEAGIWSLTESGHEALKNFPNSTDFWKESRRLYRQWKIQDAAESGPENDQEFIEIDAVPTSSEVRLDEVREQAETEIFGYLASMDAYDFQALVAHLLRAMGHYVDWEASPGRDGGLDIVAYSHSLGSDGLPRVKVQVKGRESTKAGAKELREFNSLLHGSDVGIFVSLAGFSSEAERESRSMHDKRIILIDFRRLLELWIENYSALTESGKRLLPLATVHYLDLR